jgi:calcineurin-like phosphoesterase family protein
MIENRSAASGCVPRTPATAVIAGVLASLVPTLAPLPAQAAKLEAVFVVLGPQGAIARAVVADAAGCPAATIDGQQQSMTVRASPDATFPVLVCELPIPSGTKSATVEGSALPLPKAELKSIAAFGDTGCRLKAAKGSASGTGKGDADDDQEGKFQNCNVPSAWPFAQVAASIAAAKPDLVIHVGDYLYRESACPPRDQGCARSPHGDDWPTWKADFFAPAAPALRAAPWIVVRGNHETCRRAGAGYFRLLDPTPANAAPPCIDLIPHYTVTVGEQTFIVLDSSDAADACPCDAARYAAEFSSMRAKAGTWLVSHRPVWGFRPHRKTINESLQQALAAWGGKLPDGIALAVAGHIHVAEVLSFADKRSPQFVLGTGGTLLAGKIQSNLKGEKIGGTTVSYGRADHRFGFAMFEPVPGGWTATFRDSQSKTLFGCKVGAGEAACK